MVDILVLQDNSCQLQDGLDQRVKDLILVDNVGSHFKSVDSWDENLIYPMWDGTKIIVDVTKKLEAECREAYQVELKLKADNEYKAFQANYYSTHST